MRGVQGVQCNILDVDWNLGTVGPKEKVKDVLLDVWKYGNVTKGNKTGRSQSGEVIFAAFYM